MIYMKEDVRAVGISGDAERSVDPEGNVVWTLTGDGAAEVKWKDATLPSQMHPNLKAGSTIRRLGPGSYEIKEVL